MENTFAVAINCIDGRVQIPVTEWIKINYLVDYVDMVTEPGPNKVISDGIELDLINGIKNKVELSIENHDSRILVIAAHHDCKSNKASKEVQVSQLRKAIITINSWGLDVEIIGLWVNEAFVVEEI